MARKKSRKVDTNTPAPTGFGGLGSLLAASGIEATEEPAAQPTTKTPTPTPTKAKKPGRVVLRREKKGRGGKVVTTLTRHSLNQAALVNLAKRLRKALGCGAGVEDDMVVLQGDQRDRTAQLLEADGWRVVRG